MTLKFYIIHFCKQNYIFGPDDEKLCLFLDSLFQVLKFHKQLPRVKCSTQFKYVHLWAMKTSNCY